MNTPRQHPFRIGIRYQVCKAFKSRDSFELGEVLTFVGDSYSRYDGMSGFDFRNTQGDLKRWDIHDDESMDLCSQNFQQAK